MSLKIKSLILWTVAAFANILSWFKTIIWDGQSKITWFPFLPMRRVTEDIGEKVSVY